MNNFDAIEAVGRSLLFQRWQKRMRAIERHNEKVRRWLASPAGLEYQRKQKAEAERQKAEAEKNRAHQALIERITKNEIL